MCRRCGVWFRRDKSVKGRTYCSDCEELVDKEWKRSQKGRSARPRNLRKTCQHCGRDFVADRGQQKYCTSDCKARARVERRKSGTVAATTVVACETCGKKFRQSKVFHRFCSKSCWQKNDKTKRAASNKRYWYTYGLDLDVLQKWDTVQNHRCEVCRRPIKFGFGKSVKDKGVVDHDHDTGDVRGLICQPCNLALGASQDDPQVLKNLILYLRNAQSPRRKEAIRKAQEGDVNGIQSEKFPHLW